MHYSDELEENLTVFGENKGLERCFLGDPSSWSYSASAEWTGDVLLVDNVHGNVSVQYDTDNSLPLDSYTAAKYFQASIKCSLSDLSYKCCRCAVDTRLRHTGSTSKWLLGSGVRFISMFSANQGTEVEQKAMRSSRHVNGKCVSGSRTAGHIPVNLMLRRYKTRAQT